MRYKLLSLIPVLGTADLIKFNALSKALIG